MRDSQALLAAVEEANRRVLSRLAQRSRTWKAWAPPWWPPRIWTVDFSIASVGDSRAYVLDDAGFRAITDDQTWVNEVGRPLGLDEESLRHHPMRHVLTMAIGASAPLTVNYYAVRAAAPALAGAASPAMACTA